MIGIDIGFGYTKIFAGQSRQVKFPSVFAEYSDRLGMGEGMSCFSKGLDQLILDVGLERYLIGNIARIDGGSSTFNKENFLRHRLCMLAGIALVTEEDYVGPIVMGLPISDLKKKNKLIVQLKDKYSIKLLGQKHDICIDDIWVVPQGAAAYFDMVYNDDGHILKNNKNAEKKVGIIDIGEKTLDFVCMNRTQFVNEESGSLDLGMHKAYLRLHSIIQSDLDINPLPHQVSSYLNKIPDAKKMHFKRLAMEIIDGISVWWNYKDFDVIYLAGGGGIALYEYIKDIIPCELIPESQESNARGYFKCGMAKNLAKI